MVPCRVQLDCSRLQLVLAVALIRSCPPKLPLRSHICRVKRKCKRNLSNTNFIMSLLDLDRDSLVRLTTASSESSNCSAQSPARSLSEETYFSDVDNQPPALDSPDTNDSKVESPSLLDRSNFATKAADEPESCVVDEAVSLLEPKEAVPSAGHDSGSQCVAAVVSPSEVSSVIDENTGVGTNFAVDCNISECAALTFLAATDHLCLYFGERSSFLPESSVSDHDFSESNIVSYVTIILNYIGRSAKHIDVAPLVLQHGADLVTRFLLHNCRLIATIRPVLLSTVLELVDSVCDNVGSSLLSIFVLIPDLAGTVIRAINSSIEKISQALQEVYRKELICGASVDVTTSPQRKSDGRTFHILQNSSTDSLPEDNVTAGHSSNLSSRSLCVVESFISILHTLNDNFERLNEVRFDLESSLKVLEKSTLFISDRHPQFVERVFESIRLIHLSIY